jgi:selenocysteine lyase/cysteine desulfurase
MMPAIFSTHDDCGDSLQRVRQDEFPVARSSILAHAGDCPLPRRVAGAIADYAHKCTTGDQEQFLWPGVMTTARAKASALLNCQPDEVAFVGPTSLGLSLIASGLPAAATTSSTSIPSNVSVDGTGGEGRRRLLNIRELG